MPTTVSPRDVVRARGSELAALADVWLVEGASALEVSLEGRCVWRKGEMAATSNDNVTASIAVDGCGELELHVRGVRGQAAQRRLDAQAQLLSSDLHLELELQQMTAELIDTQDQLLALYGLARATRRHISLDEVLSELVGELRRLTGAELAFTVAPDAGRGRLVSLPSPPEEWRDVMFRASAWANASGTLLLTGGPADAASDFIVPHSVRNLCTVPVEIEGRSVGSLGLINQRDTRFSAGTVKLLQALAEQAGGLVESAHLHERALAQERLHREMELAAAIQTALMPRTPLLVPGIELVGRFRPAAEVGGDFYDYRLRHDGQLALCVGDVSGKGWPAALVMTMALAVLRGASQAAAAPDLVVGQANADLYDELTGVDAFVTAFVGTYDYAAARLSFASAGHSPVIYRPSGTLARLLPASGPPLGVVRELAPTLDAVRMLPGDLLVVATDGFSEASNPAGELFGYARLLALVDAIADSTAAAAADKIFDVITSFAAGRRQDDDQTLLIVKGR